MPLKYLNVFKTLRLKCLSLFSMYKNTEAANFNPCNFNKIYGTACIFCMFLFATHDSINYINFDWFFNFYEIN